MQRCRFVLVFAVLLGSGASLALGQPAVDRLTDRLRQRLESVRDAGQQPGYLGLGADDIETAGQGILIKDVVVGGPADQAGIKAGDLITAANEQPIRSMEDMGRVMSGLRGGDEVKFEVDRKGEGQTVAVKLSDRGGARGGLVGRILSAPATPEAPKMGVRTRTIDDDLRRQFNLPPDTVGVVIAEVTAGSAAHKAGLPVGAVITSVNGQGVASPEQLGQVVRQAGFGATLNVGYTFRNQELERQVVLPGPSRFVGPATPAAGGPMPADADAADYQPPSGGSRVDMLERRVRELEERVRRLETLLEQR